MSYSIQVTNHFFDNLGSINSLLQMFSFAGWIGVPLFFFLSGYGLTKKYGANEPLKPGYYIMSHIIKLWKLLLPIYLIYFCIYTTNIKSAIAQITFTINILKYGNNGFYTDPNVYWFFGVILQFYLLFLIFRKLSTRWLWIICIAFVAFQYFIIYSVDEITMKWIRHNFFGWGAPFVLGIIASRVQFTISKNSLIAICITSFIGLCASLIIQWLSPLTEVCTIVFFVTLSRFATMKWACFLGIISASIFVLHPLIRQLFYSIFDSAPNYPYTMTIAFVITTILFSWAHHVILARTDKLIK